MQKKDLNWTSRIALCAAAASLFASATSAQDMRMSGSWILQGEAPATLLDIHGQPAPYTDEAQQLLQQRTAEGEAGDEVVVNCLPPGIPRLMTTSAPFTVLITPSKVTMLHEFQHTIRHAYLNEFMPSDDDIDPFFGGTSIGHWEGNTLVVKTARFNDLIRLDSAGSPQSANAKITERFTVSADGKTLENVILIEDPENYTAPWVTKLTYAASDVVQLKEDICAYKLLAPSLRDRIEGLS